MLEAPAAHTHPICGKVHTNIGDHTTATEVTFDKELSSDLSNHLCADGTWVQAESVNGRDYYVLPAGNYYLKADATIDKTILIKEGEVNICLNGHELCLNQGGVRVWEVIQINGGTLNLTDCQGGGKVCHLDYTYGRGVTLKGTGDAIMKFNMYGGNICENTHKLSTNSEAYGGGVAVESQNGTFNMYGGSISNNEASMSGKSNAHSGGVYNAGKFHLYDGAIESNKAYVASGGGRCFGGGVSNSGTFIMSGGRISKNRVSGQSNKEMYGGGVYNRERSQFTMSGGEISENTVTSYAASAYGGGVYNGGIFTLSDGGKISKNAVSGHSNEEMCGGGVYNVKINAKMVMSGGVYASAGKFNMNGKASVTKNTVNGVFVSDHAEFTVSGEPTVKENTKNDDASNVYLTGSAYIIIGGALTGGEGSIGVTKTANNVIAKNVSTDYSGKFSSDDKWHVVKHDAATNQLVLKRSVVMHTHKWSYSSSKDRSTVSVTWHRHYRHL